MSNFIDYKLGELFSKSNEKGSEGYPLLSVTLNNGVVRRDSLDRKNETNIDAVDHLLARKNYLAYNMMRVWQGALGLVQEDGLVSPAYVVLKPNLKLIEPKFAEYLFKYDHSIYKFWSYSYGLTSDRLRLYFNDFAKISVQIPNLKLQKLIVQTLTTWDEAICTVEKQLTNCRLKKKSLLQQLIPLDHKQSSRILNSLTKDLKKVKLKDLGKCIRGVSFKPDYICEKESSSSIRLLRSTNIQNGYLDTDELVIIPKKLVNRDQFLKDNDLVVCMANGSKQLVGKSAVAMNLDAGYTVGAFCAIYRPHENSNKYFLKYLFESETYRKNLHVLLAGSSINNLKGSDIENITFIVPADEQVQRKISEILLNVDNQIETLMQKLACLQREKKGLMQQLLTGKRLVKVDVYHCS